MKECGGNWTTDHEFDIYFASTTATVRQVCRTGGFPRDVIIEFDNNGQPTGYYVRDCDGQRPISSTETEIDIKKLIKERKKRRF